MNDHGFGAAGLPGLDVSAPEQTLPVVELPERRLMECPAEYLADSELLALVMPRQSPEITLASARKMLLDLGGLPGLYRAGVAVLAQYQGIDPTGARLIHAALSLATRLNRAPGRERMRLEAPGDVAEFMRPVFFQKEKEEFHVLLLDPRHNLIRDECVTIGLADRSQVHAREVFRTAIRENACRVILCHNHPSGDPMPSPQDIECTRGLVGAGKLIGIDVIDHIIVGERTPSRPVFWLSFRETNLLFPAP